MLMKTFAQHGPLTDAELDRLAEFLESCKGGRAMNVETLDGFFAALIAGPESVMPSDCTRARSTCQPGSTCGASYHRQDHVPPMEIGDCKDSTTNTTTPAVRLGNSWQVSRKKVAVSGNQWTGIRG
jgi:hypothetical protein